MLSILSDSNSSGIKPGPIHRDLVAGDGALPEEHLASAHTSIVPV
ncbi:hypothetical protein ACTXJ3_15550 [Brachybacterium paraconglomeratum]